MSIGWTARVMTRACRAGPSRVFRSFSPLTAIETCAARACVPTSWDRLPFGVMPTIREELEDREFAFLAPQAAKSRTSRGRLHPEAEDPIRPVFQRDRDRIIHS